LLLILPLVCLLTIMIPTDSLFKQTLACTLRVVANVEGHLTQREVACLAWLASAPTASGEILEIGSFKGRSTIVLALASRLAGVKGVVAVDPLTSPSVTDPILERGESSVWERFQTNLRDAGVTQEIEFHQELSTDLARTWSRDRKIRLLWIDGDHTYRGAKTDFDSFRPHLADGAIVAMHDVLHHHGGPARVFAEDILLSRQFGAAGFSGSIGWSQFFDNPAHAEAFHLRKLDLYRRLTRVLSYSAFGGDIEGRRRLAYRLARARVPHGDLNRRAWTRDVRDRSSL